MKKKLLAIGLLSAIMLICSAFFFVACDNEPEEEEPEVPEDTVTYSTSTNPYADTTWEEYGDLFDWSEKWYSDPIYYIFEGSYSEAYQGNYSRTYLYMNCYEDGSLHAQYGSENYYGYWTNVDNYGRSNIVLHIVRYNNGEYNNGIYESVVSSYSSSYYTYQSSIIWNQWGTRTVLIFGYRYSPVTQITLDTSGVETSYVLGESLDTSGLSVTVTRENGASALVEEVSGNYTHVNYDGFDSSQAGTQTITVSYDRETATATYQVTVADVDHYEIDISSDVKTEYYVGDSFDTTGITVTAVYENEETQTIASRNWDIEGFDTSEVVESQTVTISYGGASASFEITILPLTYTGTDIYFVLETSDVATVELNGKTVEIQYSTTTIANSTILTLEALVDETALTDAEWQDLYKQYKLDDDEHTATAIKVYSLTGDAMQGISGGTTDRWLLLDEENGTITITYTYYYNQNLTIWVYEYEREGDIITLTELVSRSGGYNTGTGLVMEYELDDENNEATPITED